MAYQQNQTIGILISSLLGIGIYTFYMIQRTSSVEFDGSITSSWGWLVLGTIIFQVVAIIIVSILVAIAHAIITKDEDPILEDERDQLFELKSSRFAFTIFGAGFMLAMLSLAVGYPSIVMFNIIVYSLFGAGIVGYIARLYYYRRGY
ncbi:MAG: DUF2178 domain-containing protein [Anaerolineae bacterium]